MRNFFLCAWPYPRAQTTKGNRRAHGCVHEQAHYWQRCPLIAKHKHFGLVQPFVISTLSPDMGRRMVIDTGMVVVIFISLMFRVHQKCVSVLYLIWAFMYRMSKKPKNSETSYTNICILFGMWNSECHFLFCFRKRSWLTEWLVDLDASQNNLGTQ